MNTRTIRIGLAALLCAAGLLHPRASAQVGDPDQERARQLVARIRRSMREIDSLLLAGSQESAAKEIAANVKRLDDLLQETESKSQAVIQNIDELVKLSKYQKSQSDPNSGGSGKSGNPSGAPPTPPKPGDERKKSQDPLELQQQPQPDPQDSQSSEKEKQDKDKKSGKGDPKSGRPDKSQPKKEQAERPPPDAPTGEFERKDTNSRWGVLPPKEAEDLQRRDVEEFPQRYRLWMELYYRRVNRLPSRDH